MELFFRKSILFATLVLTAISLLQLHLTSAVIGVDYGMLGDNLPSPSDVIGLYKRENIPLLRLYDPNPDALNALKGSGIKVAVGVKNEDVANIANNVQTAIDWVNNNIVPYAHDVNFGWIVVGNEMVPAGPNAELLPQAMNNILSGLNAAGLTGIKISTAISTAVLGVSSPPSAGDFTSEAIGLMQGILTWLAGTQNPILLNVYPYFAYASDPSNVPLDFALFNPAKPVIDGQYTYNSLFEAMVDAFVAALEKHGGISVPVTVSETGWPTAGNDPYTSVSNAQTYNQKLIDKMKQTGTPRRPADIMDIFVFAMFNEDQKPAGVEQNWGLHFPSMEPVYPLTF